MSMLLLLREGGSAFIPPEVVTKKNKELLLDKDFDLVYRLGFTRIDCWNTLGRPTSPKEIVVGYNIQTNAFEVNSGGTWRSVTLS